MTSSSRFKPKPGVPLKLAPGLRLLLAPNPSPMTYLGTNTYLLGTRDIAVIDPGPPEDTHLKAILDSLEAHQRISHIFVTHSHIDHSPLAMVLAQITGAHVHGYGDSRAGRAPIMASLGDLAGGEGVDETFMPDIPLRDGETVSGSDWSLDVLHTPGHMGNHICLAWREEQAVFSGDLVMGWSTSLISPPDGHLSDFMTSLERLSQRESDRIYYPGHGGPVAPPQTRVVALKEHRRSREAQILAALEADAANVHDLTRRIYTDIDAGLHGIAERNVLAHLIDLSARGRVSHDGKLALTSCFRIP